MKTYLLSESAKQCEWQVWKHLGGCGLSDFTRNQCGRIYPKTTLGELQNRCIVAGRETARFATEHLNLKDWAVVEYDIPDKPIHPDDQTGEMVETCRIPKLAIGSVLKPKTTQQIHKQQENNTL